MDRQLQKVIDERLADIQAVAASLLRLGNALTISCNDRLAYKVNGLSTRLREAEKDIRQALREDSHKEFNKTMSAIGSTLETLSRKSQE